MATAKKDIEIFVEALELDSAVFAGESNRIADFKIVCPRPSIAQKVSSKTLAVKDGKCAKLDSKRWIDTILFKEGVQGDFGIEVAVSSPVSDKELEAASASAASTLVKLFGDLAEDAIGIKALRSFADLPSNALAKVVSGASYSAKTDAVGSLDVPASVYAGLKGGEEAALSLPLLADRDIAAEKHRSSKSRTSIVSRKTLARKGAEIGKALLRIRAMSVILAALALAGCGTVREAREAQKGDALLPGERIVAFAETAIATNETATVAQLEDVALAASPRVLQAHQAVIAAQIAVRDAKAAYIPTLDAAAGYTYKAAKASAGSGSTHDGAFGGQATLTWLAYDFGKSRAAKRKAVTDLIAAERDSRTVENATRYGVRSACYALKRTTELREVAAETAAIYAEHLKQMKDRHEVGAVNSYAVTKAGVDWAQSVLTAVTASNAVHSARTALNMALGLESAPELAIEDGGIATYEGLGVEDLMAIARTNSPALASLRASAEGASYYVDYTVANLYPSLGLTIQYQASYDDSTLLWTLTGAGQLSQSVFCAGRKKRMIEAAVAQLRIARARVAEEELALHNSLTQAVLDAVRAGQQLEVARQILDMARENYDIVSQSYDVGKASELERSDAQVALSSAKANVVSAKYDYYDSQILISKLIGE